MPIPIRFKAKIDGMSPATGATFALLPLRTQLTFTKVVQDTVKTTFTGGMSDNGQPQL